MTVDYGMWLGLSVLFFAIPVVKWDRNEYIDS